MRLVRVLFTFPRGTFRASATHTIYATTPYRKSDVESHYKLVEMYSYAQLQSGLSHTQH